MYDTDLLNILKQENKIKYYLLGLFLTNINNNSINISLHKEDIVLLNDIKQIFGIQNSLIRDNYINLTIYSSKLSRYLEDFKINFLQIIPEEFIVNFLHGIFDGSGSINENSIYLYSGNFNKVIELYRKIGFNVSGKFEKDTLQDGFKILATLYSRVGLFMPSKYSKFLKFVRFSVDESLMEIAFTCAKRSTCLKRKVGCVITNNEKTNITAIGYNGSIRGGTNYCESGLSGKCGCIHAEQNALLKGNGPILYVTTVPCENCAKLLINAGIKEVYYASNYNGNYAFKLFKSVGIKYMKIPRQNYEWKLEISRILEWKNYNK